jgi:hypothetical protein
LSELLCERGVVTGAKLLDRLVNFCEEGGDLPFEVADRFVVSRDALDEQAHGIRQTGIEADEIVPLALGITSELPQGLLHILVSEPAAEQRFDVGRAIGAFELGHAVSTDQPVRTASRHRDRRVIDKADFLDRAEHVLAIGFAGVAFMLDAPLHGRVAEAVLRRPRKALTD